VSAPAPYYDLGASTLYCGNCLDVLEAFSSHAFDLVLTDPPYNVGKAYGQHDDAMPADEYAAWCERWFRECRRVAKRVIVFPGHGNLPIWWQIEKPSAVACWYKPGNPAAGGVFQFCEWEPFLVWGYGVGGSDVFRATVTPQKDTGDHPCPKPLPLFRDILVRFKPKSVLDPFCGSGTTLRAAADLGIKAVGCELETRFCDIAVRRLGQATLPLAVDDWGKKAQATLPLEAA
jgi:DNA modification methylase